MGRSTVHYADIILTYLGRANFLRMNKSMKMSGGRAVVESLRAEDVRYVFGIVGSCMVEILDDMYERKDIGWIGTRHEQGAAHMADGYARVSGKAGVCMATNGPGATNLTTGLSVALLSHSPLIAITGAPMVSQQYRDSFQEIDQVAMFRPLTKWSVQVPRADRSRSFSGTRSASRRAARKVRCTSTCPGICSTRISKPMCSRRRATARNTRGPPTRKR